ncbi:MAG: ABC transporter permease [Deltaproteobacteria bacterium]|nr:ABC transporter permease [Deltaproteobacteria bacterium]
MTLRTYVIRRSILIILTFFFISVIIFAVIHLAPGDPTRAFVGHRRVSPDILEAMRIKWGLDRPLHEQYFIWLGRLLQGDFGRSFVDNRPVIEVIGERVTLTLELMLVAETISVTIAIVLGVIAAVKHYSIMDALSSLGALIGYSTPNFWIALMMIMVFAVWLGWLPAGGMRTLAITFPSPLHALLDHLKHLVLPVSVLVLGWTAYLYRMARSSMLEVLSQDYITTASAKGLKERVVIFKHALRNALLPVITYEGYSMGFLFGGAAVIEYIFAWIGLGQLMVERATIRDYPTLMGLSMIIAIMVLLANLCADIAYAIADPRIRYD